MNEIVLSRPLLTAEEIARKDQLIEAMNRITERAVRRILQIEEDRITRLMVGGQNRMEANLNGRT